MIIHEHIKIFNTLRSLIDTGCGIVGGLEKISKPNSQGIGIVGGLQKSGKFNSLGVGISFFLSFFFNHKNHLL